MLKHFTTVVFLLVIPVQLTFCSDKADIEEQGGEGDVEQKKPVGQTTSGGETGGGQTGSGETGGGQTGSGETGTSSGAATSSGDTSGSTGTPPPPPKAYAWADISPIISANCTVNCHLAGSRQPLTSSSLIWRGWSREEVVEAIKTEVSGKTMPPQPKSLSEKEIQDIVKWVDDGAMP